jgi:(p)ppGpp synthase/HD superfamily hydrolase
MVLVEKARYFAVTSHESVNHYYGDEPYETHLKLVHDTALLFIQHMNDEDKGNILAACWLHDVLEDVHFVSYNDLVQKFNVDIANVVYALTNEKGKSRDERANSKYYKGIRETPYATLVKICDRIANTATSKASGSKMYLKYKTEYPKFRKELHKKFDYTQAWDLLDTLNDYKPKSFLSIKVFNIYPLVGAVIIGFFYYLLKPDLVYEPSITRGVITSILVYIYGLYRFSKW